MSKLPIILASSSPRRIELMAQVGFEVIVRKPGTDEKLTRGETPSDLVARLAHEKATDVSATIAREFPNAIIIAADTTVVAPDGKTILGKPLDAKDAERMLQLLAGETHTVLTGYCILRTVMGKPEKIRVRVVKSRVRMRTLTRTEISRYVSTGEPLDKAGSYAAQGIGMSLIRSLRGSYTNVVGLPMAHLVADLKRVYGIEPDWSKVKLG